MNYTIDTDGGQKGRGTSSDVGMGIRVDRYWLRCSIGSDVIHEEVLILKTLYGVRTVSEGETDTKEVKTMKVNKTPFRFIYISLQISCECCIFTGLGTAIVTMEGSSKGCSPI